MAGSGGADRGLGGADRPAWSGPARPAASVGAAGVARGAFGWGSGWAAGASVAAFACLLLLPAVASALMVARGLGPFAAPFEPVVAAESRAVVKQMNAADVRSWK